jgi:alkylation response protein AidB-like acyl-CoA dehydrogenase
MTESYYSHRDLLFHLFEVSDIETLTSCEYFSGHDADSFRMVLDTARHISAGKMYPYFTEMDREPPVYENGRVKVHGSVREFMKLAGEGGWINCIFSEELGGQQFPVSLYNAVLFIFAAANYSLSVYPGLTTGAAHLIVSFGSDELKEIYLPHMFSGEWQGTMALTEDEAGSSLSDVKTSAEPAGDGSYLIKGQKIFISAGDHNGVENIIHLMLARIKGAEAGVKGLSLFVVPRLRPGKNGLEENDLVCAGLYHKMGYRGAPIVQLVMGEENNCRGWLVGEPGMGLRYMFQMMNEARIGVGLAATGIATAAFSASLEYARERPQGRKLMEKDPLKPQVPIIEHADVKRMLLMQKAISEGSLSLILYTSRLADLARITGEDEKEKYLLLLDLLTPVAKTYPSEMGILSTSQAIQCLGGYGYCDDFPAEQYLRDIRIHTIHEGTTGIQGMDLLGRKVTMKNGRALEIYMQTVKEAIAAGKEDDELKEYAGQLDGALSLLESVTAYLLTFALKGEIEMFLADSTLYLELMGIITIAWQWLLQGIAAREGLQANPDDADFYNGKILTMNYFYRYELPRAASVADTLENSGALILEMRKEYF